MTGEQLFEAAVVDLELAQLAGLAGDRLEAEVEPVLDLVEGLLEFLASVMPAVLILASSSSITASRRARSAPGPRLDVDREELGIDASRCIPPPTSMASCSSRTRRL